MICAAAPFRSCLGCVPRSQSTFNSDGYDVSWNRFLSLSLSLSHMIKSMMGVGDVAKRGANVAQVVD